MNEMTIEKSIKKAVKGKPVTILKEHIVEIISDSGEGAQRCGQSLGSIAAKMGNGIWTTEIIPAEIRPPARSVAGASGNRIRIGSSYVTNGGDETDLVVAFNEQVLLGRVRDRELKPGCIILLESMWRKHQDLNVSMSYIETHDRLVAAGYKVYEIPMEQECRLLVSDARRGKNMFALGMLCHIYSLELQLAREQIAFTFGKKAQSIIDSNVMLLEAGHRWAQANLDFSYRITGTQATEAQIVTNGNIALALGVMASGMELCAMYPITPATSASHYLSEVFEKVGGIVHQAEDEISACAFAIGASYASKCTVTITSGPGYSLKQEAIGLAVMGEIPLVVVNVMRGGPSTGQPTKAEQGDLMTAIFGSHGDAPKVVMAPATIEDCFYSIITARKIAETFNMVVVVLTDAGLATSQQPFVRPAFNDSWIAPPFDQSPVPEGAKPYDWDPVTGLARRFIPGQPGGMHTLTGLAHDRQSHVAYDADINQESLRARSLKLAALQRTLSPPTVFGEPKGDLLVVGWGSTKGAIEEAVAALSAEGRKVSSMHLRFLQPLPPGIKEVLAGFKKVMTIETNWSDSPDEEIIDESNRRYSSVAILLRSRYLVDIDCWSEVKGQPIKPGTIRRVLLAKLKGVKIMNATDCLLHMYDEQHDLEDYQSGVPRWCTGCGDSAILAAVQRLCRDEGLRPEKTVFVSGIGCSSRFPHYMKTYGFHGIHGRALPVAEGVKMARPDLTVFVNTGDGDCCSIGAAHWIHAIRYNMNITVFLHDNQIYGLTKKQASPTSPKGTKSNTTPHGSYLDPINPLTTTLGVANVSFVAQAVDWIPESLFEIVKAAYHHKGFSFVRILQRCPEWLPDSLDPWMHDPDKVELLHHENGLQLSAGLSGVYKNQLLHDPSDINRAREISAHEDVVPVGILYRNPNVPCYEDTRQTGVLRTNETIRKGFEAELDKYAA